MSRAIEGLTPPLVWKYFAEIARIPRCSKNEAAAARFVVDTARRLGLAATQDSAGNVIVRKPASSGRRGAPSVCLQSHLDMVGEKVPTSPHDFARDPIEIVRKGDVLVANGTTLGADNGIGVATSLALMEDRASEHGPLEFLFTIDEETGLTGASSLQPGALESKTLLNLDSEEEGEIYVGCAGGRDVTGTWVVEFERAPRGSVAVAITVSGLRGGHSGLEIDKGRGNAIKILNRVIVRLGDLGARLSQVSGGNKRNAIPRDAGAVLFIPKARLADAQSAVGELNTTIKAELATVEPALAIAMVESTGKPTGKVVKRALQRKLTQVISGLPHGVIKMSADIPGLVETSTNVAVITTGKKDITLATSQRSSVASEILEIVHTVRSVFGLGGAKVTGSNGYPGWKPDLASPILKLAIATYSTLYGKEPAVKAVHAGLECGIIGEKFPGMDMISFGPTLQGVHSPDEQIDIPSVQKYWDFLLALLKSVR
jgi:dipeptidase D